MSRPSVVVVGDALLDVDLVGAASRLAPDSPVPVVEHVAESARPGGAALAAALTAADQVDVTLVTQTDAAIGLDSAGDTAFGTQVLLTSAINPSAGGVAWLGASTGYDPSHDPMWRQPALVFGSSGGGEGHRTAQAAAHEAGHTFGLVHEGASSEYYSGTTTWGPIMGASYGAAMGQWSKGEFKAAP